MSKQNEFMKSVESNNIKQVELLLKDKDVDPSLGNSLCISVASLKGHIEIVRLLLNDKRADPSDNPSIIAANTFKFYNVVQLLWADDRVKQDLLNYDIQSYNHFKKKFIKEKLEKF